MPLAKQGSESSKEREPRLIGRRYRYTKDYKRTTYVGVNGRPKERVVYIGKWICPTDDPETYRRIVLVLRIAVGIAAAAVAGALFSVPAPMEHKWYVPVLVLSLFPLAYAVIGACLLPNKPTPMERAKFDKSFLRMKQSAVAGLIILALAAIGAIVYWILKATGVIQNAAPFALLDGIFFLCLLLGAAAYVAIYREAGKLHTETRENAAYKP